MHPFSILMFIFAGAILLYAGLLALTKDYNLIPRGHAAEPGDRKAYALACAKMLALVALAPLSAAIYGLFSLTLGAVMFPVGLVVCIGFGTRCFKGL